MKNKFFTSESVTEGHPDKICDQISDAVLDAYLAKDPYARVACETTAAKGALMVMGEVTADCAVDIDQVAREILNRIGYGDPRFGFDARNIAVLTALSCQSPDIAMGVDGHDIGAGDQGMVFGYACTRPMSLYQFPSIWLML